MKNRVHCSVNYFYVSAAAGAVGQLVGQLAQLHGCYVVGSAGTSQKVESLKSKLGFDEAFNYKEELDLEATLARNGLVTSLNGSNIQTEDPSLEIMRRCLHSMSLEMCC